MDIRSPFFSDYLTFGHSETKILAIVAGETIVIGATFFVTQPPFLPVPVSDVAALLITGLLTVILAIILYVLLSGLGYQTYSITFHKPVHILKCWVAYLTLSTVVVYTGYLLLVYPYTSDLIPKPIDIGIGAVLSTAYAISIASIIYGEGFFSDNTNPKPEEIDEFLTAAKALKQKPESDIVDEPGRLIQAGESILARLRASDLQGTNELASGLQDWLEAFRHRELQGQKKMVGDLPDSSAQFAVWEDRYDAFRDIKMDLEQMDNSAIRRVLLSIRGK